MKYITLLSCYCVLFIIGCDNTNNNDKKEYFDGWELDNLIEDKEVQISHNHYWILKDNSLEGYSIKEVVQHIEIDKEYIIYTVKIEAYDYSTLYIRKKLKCTANLYLFKLNGEWFVTRIEPLRINYNEEKR